MTLSSVSTLAEVNAAYDDNASYEEQSSLSMAREFISACRILLRRTPQMAMHDGKNQLQNNLTVIRQEMERAQRWIDRQPASSGSTSGGVVQHTFQDFRG